MAIRKYNFFQEYEFTDSEKAEIEILLSNDLLQMYFQNQLARKAKKALMLQNRDPQELALRLEEINGSIAFGETLIRTKEGN